MRLDEVTNSGKSQIIDNRGQRKYQRDVNQTRPTQQVAPGQFFVTREGDGAGTKPYLNRRCRPGHAPRFVAPERQKVILQQQSEQRIDEKKPTDD